MENYNYTTQKAIVRSPNYPRYPLNICVKRLTGSRFLANIDNISEQDFIKLIGHKSMSGTCYPKVSAMERYGLVKRTGECKTAVYSITDLAMNILNSETEEESTLLLQKSFYSVSLFRGIKQSFERYKHLSDVESYLIALHFRSDVIPKVIATYDSNCILCGLSPITLPSVKESAVSCDMNNQLSPNANLSGMPVTVSGKLVVDVKDGLSLSFSFKNQLFSEAVNDVNKCIMAATHRRLDLAK